MRHNNTFTDDHVMFQALNKMEERRNTDYVLYNLLSYTIVGYILF